MWLTRKLWVTSYEMNLQSRVNLMNISICSISLRIRIPRFTKLFLDQDSKVGKMIFFWVRISRKKDRFCGGLDLSFSLITHPWACPRITSLSGISSPLLNLNLFNISPSVNSTLTIIGTGESSRVALRIKYMIALLCLLASRVSF